MLGNVTRKHFWIENEFMNILSKDWLNIIINFKLRIICYTYRHHQERHNVEKHKVNHVQQLGVEHLTVQDTYLLLLPVLRVDVLNGLAENKLGRGVNCRCNPNCDNDHLQKKKTRIDVLFCLLGCQTRKQFVKLRMNTLNLHVNG